jgi:RimJ/RimL family protein N-acetyltransferase
MARLLTVRDIQEKDVDFIADYWENNSLEFLQGMGVDPKKLPSREERHAQVVSEINTPFRNRKTWWLIWELNNLPVAYSTLAEIEYGKEAEIHFQICNAEARGKGFGSYLFLNSANLFFEKFQLMKIIGQPISTNYPINRLFQKMGVNISKTYRTTPSPITGEEEVNRYELTRWDVMLKLAPLNTESGLAEWKFAVNA